MIESVIPLILHLDQHFTAVVHEYGMWTYLLIFCIIFFETGFVIFPFLPGDSLLFVAGAAAASGILDLQWLVIAIIAGAVLGDTVNYWIGNYVGIHVFIERFPNLVKKEYIDRTYGFYEKYGGATVFVARFVPVVRTFAPFLAGVGSMKYHRFLFFNILGATAWTLVVVLAGYYLGTFSVVQDNMGLLLIGVLIVTAATVLLIAWGVISSYICRKPAGDDEKE
jgi:membrane-associated protein